MREDYLNFIINKCLNYTIDIALKFNFHHKDSHLYIECPPGKNDSDH